MRRLIQLDILNTGAWIENIHIEGYSIHKHKEINNAAGFTVQFSTNWNASLKFDHKLIK